MNHARVHSLLLFQEKRVRLLSGSCHLDRASNVEIGVECHIFVIVFFFNCGQVFQVGAHSRPKLKRDHI